MVAKMAEIVSSEKVQFVAKTSSAAVMVMLIAFGFSGDTYGLFDVPIQIH